MKHIYVLVEGGFQYETIEAKSAQDALQVAKDNVSWDNYEEDGKPLFIEACVFNLEYHDDAASATVILDPNPPTCSGDSHDWQSPIEIVGGCKENPGVHGHGGGAIINEVCVNCGTERITDTWAQNPCNGTQGYTTVQYDRYKYEEEVRDGDYS